MKHLVQSIVVLSTCAAAVMVQAETAGAAAHPGAGRAQAPAVGGEIAIDSLPFNAGEVIRAVRENRGLPEEHPKQGFHAEARGERPFVSKGNAFSHKTPRFQAEIDAYGLRYFAQGNMENPDFEILSVSFERGNVSQTVFGKNHLEEHAPGLLQGKARDGVTPYVRNRGKEGVEMYWATDEPLSSGASALRVHFLIRAAGEPEVHPEGLVFPAWREEGQVTLSNVTVVDAAGRRERVRPSLATSQEILFEVPHEFLASARYPILIDPTVGPEFPVEPSPVIGPAAYNQSNPSVASNGTDYFVVWDDWRNGADADIYGTRVALDGTVLDPTGIAVSTAANWQESPSVASNGTDYFVAWMELRSGTLYDVYGARVAPDGTVLDPAGIAVSTEAGSQFSPSVASNGTDYFVAWEDRRSGTNLDIYGARVTAGGAVLDPAGIIISTAANNQWFPSVASSGTDYFVVWEDYRSGTEFDIYGARVQASNGLLLDGPPDTGGVAVSTATGWQDAPSVASNGTDYFIAWRDWRNDGGCWCNTDIYGARVASDGTVLDPAGIAVSTAVDEQWVPSVASNGTDYFIAWSDNRSGTDYDIYGARVAPDGTVLDPAGIAVSTAASDQQYPSAASNGTDYFIAWRDFRNDIDADIYGGRVRASDGALLDGPPDTGGIAASTAANNQEYPSAVSNGTDYFVVWEDWRSGTNRDIYGARVAPDGTVLDSTGIAVTTEANDQRYPSVASNGTDYFVVWEDWRSGTTDIYGARVAPDGTVLDPAGIAVSTEANGQFSSSVTSNGTDYFVTWEDYRNDGGCLCNTDIYGARVAPDGTVLDPAGIAVSTTVDIQLYPSVASNGADYFVAWEDWRNDGGCTCNRDTYGARVTSAGTVLDPAGIAVSTEANNQLYPSVASNGTGYFIAWEDSRSGTGMDIYGARVTSAGTVLDATGLLIQQSSYDDLRPAVAYSACGKYLVAYFRFYDDPDFQSRRVMARTMEDDVPSAGEVSAPGTDRPLTVERASGQVKIFWEGLPSDCAGVIQYNIYEGDLDAPLYNHFPLVCWTAGTDEGDGYLSEIITPVAPNAYYLVTECDTAAEGTPGYDSAGVERDNPLGTCGPHP
ncbi:MAG: hypothetical protein JSV08_08910 [Acidobacteriota bacterium]|nr:MAG: hypothetical protein JSV08_08910 [Acidobacteriota bacterium]